MSINKFRLSSVVFIFFVLALSGGTIWLDSQYQVPVLMYHNIGPNPQGRVDTVTPENFERQIRFIQRKGYQVLPLREFVEGVRAGRRLSRSSVVITFDDGMGNNFSQALPILKRHNISATFFVPAGKLGQSGRMTWDEIRALLAAGMDIGSHGMMEEYLPDLSPAEQRQEIFQSKFVLEQGLNTTIALYAYPVGGFRPESKALVAEAGYRGAVTTNRGTTSQRDDPFELRRIKITDNNVSAVILWAKLSGYYDFFRRPKKPF